MTSPSAAMTSPASTSSWFSGIVRTASGNPPSSAMPPAGGVTSAPVSLPDTPAAVSCKGGVVASVATTGVGARRKQLQGTLFKYGPKSAQVAFRTGDFTRQVIFIGGLTDGLLATDYLEPLSFALEVEKWSLIQPLLSSSYTGYGISSLEQDASELDQLIGYLINKDNSEGVILLGHSTGCQDIIHYMRTNFACSKAVSGVILQAPVSDREYRATLPETGEMIDLAAKMISSGRGMDLMPREANSDAPITAYRCRNKFYFYNLLDFELQEGMGITVLRAPQNAKDPHAVKVLYAGSDCGQMLGYVPRELAKVLAPLLDTHFIQCEGLAQW